MSKKFVRSTKDVKDINKISENFIEENDIISTTDGKVYIATKTGFTELGGSDDIDSLKQEITNLKSENTKLKNRVTTLETDYKTLSDRVTVLETPAPTE